MIPDIWHIALAKGTEYLIAIAFLVLFIPFWRFVNKAERTE